MTLAIKQIPIKDALNLAVQAYIQNGKYHREDQYEYVESDEVPAQSVVARVLHRCLLDATGQSPLCASGLWRSQVRTPHAPQAH